MKKCPNLLKCFLKDKNVASVIPTSKSNVKYLCNKINFERHITIIEYGPGTGVFTKYLLNKLTKKSKIIAIETNKQLTTHLTKIKDKRLIIINESAENIKNILKKLKIRRADYIISGIPFSLIKKQAKQKIIRDSYKLLTPEGKFLIYQTSPKIKKDLKKQFEKVDSKLKLINIPPLIMIEAGKLK